MFNWWLKAQQELCKQILDSFALCLHKDKYSLNPKFYQFFSKVLSDQDACQSFLKSSNYFLLLRLYQQSLQKYTDIDNETSITLQRTYNEKVRQNYSEISQHSLISTLSVDEDAVIEPTTETNLAWEMMSDRSILSELGNQFFDNPNQSQIHPRKSDIRDPVEGQEDAKSDMFSVISNVQAQYHGNQKSIHERRRNSQLLNASQSNCSYKLNNSSNISKIHRKKSKITDSGAIQTLATKGPMTMEQIQHTIPKIPIPQLNINELSRHGTNVFANITPRQFFEKNSTLHQIPQNNIPIKTPQQKHNQIDYQFENAVKQMQKWHQGAKLLENIGFQLGQFIALQDYPLIYKFQHDSIMKSIDKSQKQTYQQNNVSFKLLQQVDNVDEKVEHCFVDVDDKIKQLARDSPNDGMNIIRYGTMLIIYSLITNTPQSQQQIYDGLIYPILYDITTMRKNRNGVDKIQINSIYAVILQIFKQQQVYKQDVWNTAMQQIFEYVTIGYQFIDINTDKEIKIEEDGMKVVEKKFVKYPQQLSVLSRLEGYRRNIIPFITYIGQKLTTLCQFYSQISALEEIIILLGTLIDMCQVTSYHISIRGAIIEQCLPCLIKLLNYLQNKQCKSRQYYIFISNKIIKLFSCLINIKEGYIGDQVVENINQIFINIFFYQKIQVFPWLKRYAYLIFLNPKIIVELSGVFLHMEQCQYTLYKYQINLCTFFSNLSKLIDIQLYKSINNRKFQSLEINQCLTRNNQIKTGVYSNFKNQSQTSKNDFKIDSQITDLPLQSLLQINQLSYNHILRVQEQSSNKYDLQGSNLDDEHFKEYLFLIDYQYGVLMQYLLQQHEQIATSQQNRYIYINVLDTLQSLFSLKGIFKQLPQNQINQHITFHYTSFIKFFKKNSQEFQSSNFISDQSISCKHLQVMQAILTTYPETRHHFYIIKIIDYLIQQILQHNGYDLDNNITITVRKQNTQNTSSTIQEIIKQKTIPLLEYQINIDNSFTCTDSDGWGETAKRLGIDLNDYPDNADYEILNQHDEIAQQQVTIPKFQLNIKQLQQRKYSITNNFLIEQNEKQQSQYIEIQENLNIQIIQFIFCMIINPHTEMFDQKYVVQYLVNKNLPNIPIILYNHFKNPKNKSILRQLLEKNLQSSHSRLLRLLTNANFASDLYPLQFFDTITDNEECQIFKGNFNIHGSINQNINDNNLKYPIVAKVVKMSLNYSDRSSLYNVYNEVTVMERLQNNKSFAQLIDYGVYGRQEQLIVMNQYFMSLRKFRLLLFDKQSPTLIPYGHEQSLISYIRIFLMTYISFLKIIRLMHRKHVVHLDLKCENIFIQPSDIQWITYLQNLENNKEKYKQLCHHVMNKFSNIQDLDDMPYQLVLGDFGEALITKNHADDLSEDLQTQHGTEFNKSPEMLLHDQQNQKQYSQQQHKITYKTDIWSAACTLYEIFTGDFLFYDTDWSRFYINVTGTQQSREHRSEGIFKDINGLENCIRGIQLSKEKQQMLGHCQPLIDLLEYQLVQDPNLRPSIDQCIKMTEHVLKNYFLKQPSEVSALFKFEMNKISCFPLSTVQKQQQQSIYHNTDIESSINNSVLQIQQNDEQSVSQIEQENNSMNLQQVLLPINQYNDVEQTKQGPSCQQVSKMPLTTQLIDLCQNNTIYITNKKMLLEQQLLSQNNIYAIIDCRQFKAETKMEMIQQQQNDKILQENLKQLKRSKSVALIKHSLSKTSKNKVVPLNYREFYFHSRPNFSNKNTKDNKVLSQSYIQPIKQHNSFLLQSDNYDKAQIQGPGLTQNQLNLSNKEISNTLIQRKMLQDILNQQLVARVYQPRELLEMLRQNDCIENNLNNDNQLQTQSHTQTHNIYQNSSGDNALVSDNNNKNLSISQLQNKKDFKQFVQILEQLFGVIRCTIITGGNVLLLGDDEISAENIGLCWLMEFERIGLIAAIAKLRRRCPYFNLHKQFFKYLSIWDGLRAKTGIRLLSLYNEKLSHQLSTQQFNMLKSYPELCGLINLRVSKAKYSCACRKTFFTIKPKAKVSYIICNCVISDEYGHTIINEKLVDCPTSSCKTILNYYQSIYGVLMDKMIYALVYIDDVVGNYSRSTQQVQQIEKFTSCENYQLQYRAIDNIRAPLFRSAIKDGWYLHYCVLCGAPTHFLRENSSQICIIAVFEND